MVDSARFEALMAQVGRLTDTLAAQQSAYSALMEKLQTNIQECADLKVQLRAAKGKHSRSAEPKVETTQAEQSGSETTMNSGAEDEQQSRRRSPERTSPPNV